ncbi:hypothetical protein RDV89_02985 [Nocardioides zeae]|uniref:MBL fold metallo-hydrolase n=2 Tax=Nocardioides imazamoxiresistens TaxID=3231893 RepID=A0ABU3PS18_9ACTN|nr:hypothetical protein [Nocardioides zeae]
MSRPWGRRAAFVAAGAGGAALLRRAGAVAAVADVISELRPPDLTRWSHLVEQPVADDRARGRVRVQFLGVATLVISDGVSTILIDGFFSRPGVLRVRLGRLRPKERRITSALHRARTRHVDALFVAHSHYDHALDSAVVAGLTGAELHGSRSTRAIARSQGFDLERFRPISTHAHA